MTVKCSKSMQILRLSVIKAIVTKDYYVLLTINSCDISRRRVGYPEAWISARGAHRKRKRRGFRPAVLRLRGRVDQPNRRSTLLAACAASDSAVVDSCWRVCNARRLAPSSLVSASTRLSAPTCNVLIVDLVKSWRVCTTVRLEPKFDACERRVPSAVLRFLSAALMSKLVCKLLVEAATPRPVELNVTPETDSDAVPVSLKTTLRLSPLSRFTPL